MSALSIMQPPGERLCGQSFLMAVLNNGGTGPHCDWMDLKSGCCCVLPFGDGWTGGELAFRQLNLKFKLRPGDVIFFRSAILLHENLPHEGPRRSMVLTTDHDSFTTKGQPMDKTMALVEPKKTSHELAYAQLTSEERWKRVLYELHRRMLETSLKNEQTIVTDI